MSDEVSPPPTPLGGRGEMTPPFSDEEPAPWPVPPAALAAWPPPPPPPPAALRPRLNPRRRGAAILALAGLVAGSAVAGFFITRAVAPPAAAAAAAATGSSTPAPWPGAGPEHGHGFGEGIARVDLVKDAAKAIGITEQQLSADLRQGQSVAQVASAHGKTAQAVINTLVGDLTSAINSAESGGKISSSQASALKAHLTTMVTAFVNGTAPGGLGLPGGGQSAALQAAAKAIGVTAQQLASDLRNGQSIASVASAHGVKASIVEGAVITAVDKEIQSLKASGRLSAAQASQLTSQVAQRVDAWVTGTYPGWPFGPFGGDLHGGPMAGGPWARSSPSASAQEG